MIEEIDTTLNLHATVCSATWETLYSSDCRCYA